MRDEVRVGVAFNYGKQLIVRGRSGQVSTHQTKTQVQQAGNADAETPPRLKTLMQKRHQGREKRSTKREDEGAKMGGRIITSSDTM